jgi:hypothetical protein
MNKLVLNGIERNIENEPPLHWVTGKSEFPCWFKQFINDQMLTLTSLKLGSNLSMFGKVIQKIDGKIINSYVHIRSDKFDNNVMTQTGPLQFMSFHIIKMNG